MEHSFELPVEVRGVEHVLNGRIVASAYTYKMYLMVEDEEIVIEKDDEQNYRVISEVPGGGKPVNPELLEAIINTLQALNS